MNTKETPNTNKLICKNCGSDQVQEFCSNCGQKTIIHRYTIKRFLLKFLEAFNLERGFFYVAKMLILNPGKVIREYLGGRTKVYYNPLNYFIIIAGISSALMIWSNVFDANVHSTNELIGINGNQGATQFQGKFMDIVKQYTNVIAILTLPFMSLASLFFFNKRKLYYGEHLVLNCYLLAQTSLLGILLLPFYMIFPGLLNSSLIWGYLVMIIYYTYALKSIFKSSVLKSLLGTLFIHIIGYFLFFMVYIIIFIVGIIIFKLTGGNLKELLQ